jgi:hypothetical protein
VKLKSISVNCWPESDKPYISRDTILILSCSKAGISNILSWQKNKETHKNYWDKVSVVCLEESQNVAVNYNMYMTCQFAFNSYVLLKNKHIKEYLKQEILGRTYTCFHQQHG